MSKQPPFDFPKKVDQGLCRSKNCTTNPFQKQNMKITTTNALSRSRFQTPTPQIPKLLDGKLCLRLTFCNTKETKVGWDWWLGLVAAIGNFGLSRQASWFGIAGAFSCKCHMEPQMSTVQSFPILSRDPSCQKTIRTRGETAGS